MRRTGLSKPSIWRWQERYLEAGVDGLRRDKTRPSRIPALDQARVAEVIRRTLDEPPPGDATHWTVRAMARASRVSPAKVHQIWHEAGLAPHRIRGFKLSNDPAFAEKVEDVVGLCGPARPCGRAVDRREEPCVDGPRLAREKSASGMIRLLAVMCPAC
jgi:transposase